MSSYGLEDRDFIRRRVHRSGHVSLRLHMPMPCVQGFDSELVLKSDKDEAEALEELRQKRDALIAQHWAGRESEVLRLAPSRTTLYMKNSGRNKTGKVGVVYRPEMSKFIAVWRDGPKHDRQNRSKSYGYNPNGKRYVGSKEDAFIAACVRRDQMTDQPVQSKEHYAELFRENLQQR